MVYKGLPLDTEAMPIKNGEYSPEPTHVVDVKFEHCKHAGVKRYHVDDFRIAPANTFTQDFDWRYEIKIGDLLDVMDDEKDWYKSTVIEDRISKNKDEEDFREILVAYRTYDPEGSKVDDEGKPFYGWSERYDAWCGITDVQVQR